jgi:hypothetical protein
MSRQYTIAVLYPIFFLTIHGHVTCCFVTYFSYVSDGMNHSKLCNVLLDNKCTPGLHCLLMRSPQSIKVFNPLVSMHSREMSMTL